METRSSRSDRPSTLKPGDVPFLGWSRVAHEFRIKAAVMAPQGFRPLIIGDPGVGKRTMAKSWLQASGRGKEEWPIIDLDTWREELPDRCIAVTTKRPPSDRPCFLLESGAWGYAPQRPAGQPTLSADLMQRFAITLYVPPLHGHREIDILAFLDYWIWDPSNSSRVRYKAIDAALVLRMLFDNDWPANLEGVSRALRHSSRLIFHAEGGWHAGRQAKYEVDCLRDRWAEQGWIAPPTSLQANPTAAWPVEWLWGEPDIPVGAMADFAARLYLRFCQLSPPDPAATSPCGRDPRELLRLQGFEEFAPTLTAVQFCGLSPESFVHELVLPDASTRPGDQSGKAARLLKLVESGSILGTNVPALQAGLAINPVAVVRASAPTGRANPADLPPHRFVVESDNYFIEFHGRNGIEEGTFPRSSYLGLSYFRHLIASQGEAAGLDPKSLEHLARHGSLPQDPRHEDAAVGKGFVVRPTHQPVLDDEAKAAYEKRLKENRCELWRAERDQDLAEMQRLEEEYRSIVSELDGAFHGQHSKDLDKTAKQARDRVRKAMDDTQKRLALKQMSQLAKHLEEAMIYQDGRWSYRPPRPERKWQT